jgi:hypothetical protein
VKATVRDSESLNVAFTDNSAAGELGLVTVSGILATGSGASGVPGFELVAAVRGASVSRPMVGAASWVTGCAVSPILATGRGISGTGTSVGESERILSTDGRVPGAEASLGEPSRTLATGNGVSEAVETVGKL